MYFKKGKNDSNRFTQSETIKRLLSRIFLFSFHATFFFFLTPFRYSFSRLLPCPSFRCTFLNNKEFPKFQKLLDITRHNLIIPISLICFTTIIFVARASAIIEYIDLSAYDLHTLTNYNGRRRPKKGISYKRRNKR